MSWEEIQTLVDLFRKYATVKNENNGHRNQLLKSLDILIEYDFSNKSR